VAVVAAIAVAAGLADAVEEDRDRPFAARGGAAAAFVAVVVERLIPLFTAKATTLAYQELAPGTQS